MYTTIFIFEFCRFFHILLLYAVLESTYRALERIECHLFISYLLFWQISSLWKVQWRPRNRTAVGIQSLMSCCISHMESWTSSCILWCRRFPPNSTDFIQGSIYGFGTPQRAFLVLSWFFVHFRRLKWVWIVVIRLWELKVDSLILKQLSFLIKMG